MSFLQRFCILDLIFDCLLWERVQFQNLRANTAPQRHRWPRIVVPHPCSVGAVNLRATGSAGVCHSDSRVSKRKRQIKFNFIIVIFISVFILYRTSYYSLEHCFIYLSIYLSKQLCLCPPSLSTSVQQAPVCAHQPEQPQLQ